MLYTLATPYLPKPEWQYATVYWVVLFIPVLPIRRYLVSRAPTRGWYFHHKLSFGLCQWLHFGFVLGAIGLIAAIATLKYFHLV
jgi:hypothetical protein